MEPYLSVIVPAYNEAARIGSTLGSIRAYLDTLSVGYEIIVSADGTDGTREKATEQAQDDPRISVIGSRERGGKGRGIRNAMARTRGAIVGFVDADNKTPIEEIGKVLPWFDQGFDIVIGSRGLAESRIEVPQPWYRRFGSQLFGIGMHLTVGLWDIRDTQCGFKFFRGSVGAGYSPGSASTGTCSTWKCSAWPVAVAIASRKFRCIGATTVTAASS